jgi:hypothetical protein
MPMRFTLNGVALGQGQLEVKLHVGADGPISYWARCRARMADGGVRIPVGFDLPLDVAGSYLMRVGLDGQTCAEVPIQVRSVANASTAPTPVWMS